MIIGAPMWTSASPVRSSLKAGLAALAALACIGATDAPPLSGMWGAGDAVLAVDAKGGRLQVGCTLVRFGPVTAGPDGQFRSSAQIESLSIRPPVGDAAEDDALPEPVAQSGAVAGRLGNGAMELVLTISGQPPRTLRLIPGQRGTPARCL